MQRIKPFAATSEIGTVLIHGTRIAHSAHRGSLVKFVEAAEVVHEHLLIPDLF
jgi:hypothetical protein